MFSTTGLRKVPTTYGFVLIGSIVDGYAVTGIEHDDDGNTSLELTGDGTTTWTEWLPSEWPVSCWV